MIATLTLLPTYNVFIYFGDKVSQMLSYVSYRKFYKKVIKIISVWSMSIKRVDMKLSSTFVLFFSRGGFPYGNLTLTASYGII